MVNYVAFNPTGECLASAARDMTIKLWKRNKEQEYRCYKTLQGHDHEVSCVEYVKPDGDHLVSCSRDKSIRVWDCHSGFLLQTIEQHDEWVRRIGQSLDGKLLASASKDETVIVWNLERMMPAILAKGGFFDHQDHIVTIIDEHDHVIDCIKFAPESCCRTIQNADYSKIAKGGNVSGEVMDSTTETTPEDEEAKGFSSPNAEHEEASRLIGKARMTTKEKVAKLKADLKRKMALLRGEVVDEGEEAKDGEKVEEKMPQEADESIVIDTSKQEAEEAATKEYIATGSRDKKVRIFEAKSGRLVLTLAGHDNWVTEVFFHPNGKYLISTADDKSIRIWDLALGRCYRKIYNAHDHFISCFDMKGKLAATGSVDTSVKLWSCR